MAHVSTEKTVATDTPLSAAHEPRKAWATELKQRAFDLRADALELDKRGDMPRHVGHALRQAALRIDEAVRHLGENDA